MSSNTNFFEIDDFIKEIPSKDILKYNEQVAVIFIDTKISDHNALNPFPLQLNACSIIMITSGEMTITVDYNTYTAKENCMFVLLERHVINNVSVSLDFTGFHIIVDKNIFKNSTHDEKPPLEGLINSSRQQPLLLFNKEEFEWLKSDVHRLCYDMVRNNHIYQKSLVMNDISVFAYEIWNNSDKNQVVANDSIGHYEKIAIEFLDLVFQNCKVEHEVSYYADRLCITAIQLSRAVKKNMNKPAIVVIHDIMITEAKIMLNKSDITVQQVSDELHFSDQASFSKFFKKHVGMSPKNFKKSLVVSR